MSMVVALWTDESRVSNAQEASFHACVVDVQDVIWQYLKLRRLNHQI